MRLSLVLVLAAAAVSAQDRCAQFGLKSANGTNGYGWRDDSRCEGLFIQEVAGSGDLRVISFATPIETASLQGAKLPLAWQAPPAAAGPVHIRAASLRSRHYYRMDADAPGAPPFQWPTAVIKSEKLSGEEIALVAWTRVKLFENEDLYLPLRAGTRTNYALGMLPGAELTELYVSLARLGADGRPAETLKKEEKQPSQYYPAGQRFEVPLGKLPGPGYYRVRVAGLARYGGSVTKSIVIYLAPGA